MAVKKLNNNNTKNFSGPTGNETVVTGARAGKIKKAGSEEPKNSGTGGGRTVTYVANGTAAKGIAENWDPGYYEAMQQFYQDMLQQQTDYNNAFALQAAEYAQQQADSKGRNVDLSYDDLNRQLYRDYMLSLKMLPQYLAAMGYTGGATESAKIGLDTSYGENLNTNERERINKLADLQSEADNAANSAKIQAQKDNQSALMTMYQNIAKLLQGRYSDQQSYAEAIARLLAKYGDLSGLYWLMGNA